MIKFLFLALVLGSAPSAHALKIELNYSYDTGGFFNQPGSRAALRAVADFYESILKDSLARIDQSEWPAGNSWQARFFHPANDTIVNIPNLVVPADTLIIYAGGSALGGSAGIGGPGFYIASGNTPDWFNLVGSRGQAGALSTPPTDFGPWGGSISFNNNRSWNFSTETAISNRTSFVAIALHEIAHLLGIGIAESWMTRISGGVFTGPQSIAAYGAMVPVEGDGGHWRDDGNCSSPNGYLAGHPNNVLSDAFGSFGSPHGFDQIALMDPVTCNFGPFHQVMTDLDLAGLRDVGWEVVPPVVLFPTQLKPGPITLSWPSTTGITYRIERSTTLFLGSWSTLQVFAGDGEMQMFRDPTPPPGKAFYRLNTTPLQQPAKAAAAASQPAPAATFYRRLHSCRTGPSACCD